MRRLRIERIHPRLIRSARADGLHSLCTRNPLGVLSSPSLADLARTTIIMSNPVEIPVVSSFVEDPIPDDGRVGSVHEENVDIACTHAAPSHLKAPVTGDSIDIAASETPSAWWRRRTGVWRNSRRATFAIAPSQKRCSWVGDNSFVLGLREVKRFQP